MPRPTPSYVKGMIHRLLQEVVDSSPSKKEITKICEYFESKCSYCGKNLKTDNNCVYMNECHRILL